MKTIKYKGYEINITYSGWFTAHSSRYGILKADSLNGIKSLINHAIKAPQY